MPRSKQPIRLLFDSVPSSGDSSELSSNSVSPSGVSSNDVEQQQPTSDMFQAGDTMQPLQMVLLDTSTMNLYETSINESDFQVNLPGKNLSMSHEANSDFKVEQTRTEGRIDESVDVTMTSDRAFSAVPYDSISNYVEIDSHEEMKSVRKGSKIRISRQLARTTRSKAISAGNFGWQLAQKIYSLEERFGKKNYAGRGKPRWSPRRKEALEEAVKENYGPDPEYLKQVWKACDSGMRNIKTPSSSRVVVSDNVNLNALIQGLKIPIVAQIYQPTN